MLTAREHLITLSFGVHINASMDCDKLYSLLGVDYAVIGFDMEVQPLATHNAA